jgi:hypothetical protein
LEILIVFFALTFCLRDFPTLSVIKQYRGVSGKGISSSRVRARVEPGDVRVDDEILLSQRRFAAQAVGTRSRCSS